MSELYNPLSIPFDPLHRLPGQEQRDVRRIVEAVEFLNQSQFSGQGQNGGSYLAFSYEEKSQKLIVKVLDRETGDVVCQLPPSEVLRMAAEAKRKAGKTCGQKKEC
jgi:uncharacterized FlaG/YvyC family protein